MYSMYFKDFNGRVENEAGVFKRMGRVELPVQQMNAKQMQLLTETLKQTNSPIYFYEFIGVEPLANMQVMELVRKCTKKICNVVTSGSVKYWKCWEEQGTPILRNTWKNYEKIYIRRLSKNDAENDELLGVEALKEEHYKQMPEELKNKIYFIVDYKLSKMEKMMDVIEFIKWAKSLGIGKMVFLDSEIELIAYKNKLQAIQERILKSQRKQIEAIRNNCFNPDLVKKEEIQIKEPLMEATKRLLIKEGYNFGYMKAEIGEDGFWRVLPFEKGKTEVIFKTKIILPRNQEECWEYSARIHTYIDEIDWN